MTTTHELKLWPEFFEPVVQGAKTFEMRTNIDRDFQVGDTLVLNEYDPAGRGYTGRVVTKTVSHVMRDVDFPNAIPAGFSILSFARDPVAPGWKTVPVEPTNAMAVAGVSASLRDKGVINGLPQWRAMIAAAPEAAPAAMADPHREHLAEQALLINLDRLSSTLTAFGISQPESREELGARVGSMVNALTLYAAPSTHDPEATPTPLLMQDENSGRDGRRYNEWHASRPDARLNAREAAAAMEGDYPPLPEAEDFMYQHEDTGVTGFIDAQQVEWGFFKNNPRLQKVRGVYSEADMRAYVDADRALRPAATPAAPSAVTDQQIEDWVTTLAAYDLAGPKLLGRDRIHRFARAILALAQPAPVQAGAQQAVSDDLINWAVGRWHAEVANRPMVNVHRRSLDDAWRQVLRHLGVDDRARLGATHDELRNAISTDEWNAMTERSAS